MSKEKFAIYKTSVGLRAVYYADCKEHIKNFPYISTDNLPVLINMTGGYCPFILKYEKQRDFVKIIEVEKGQSPLTREQQFPKNSDLFYFGWISPSGDTYACDFEYHMDCAEAICKEMGFDTYNASRTLEEKGWISVYRSAPYTPGEEKKQELFQADRTKVTKKQYDKVAELGLFETMGGHVLKATYERNLNDQ